jgi:hypothetical protein
VYSFQYMHQGLLRQETGFCLLRLPYALARRRTAYLPRRRTPWYISTHHSIPRLSHAASAVASSLVASAPASEQCPRSLVVRTMALLLTVRAEQFWKQGHVHLAVTPEILTYLAALRPWSTVSARQLDAISWCATSGVLSQRAMRLFLLRVLQHARTLVVTADELAGTRAVESERSAFQRRRQRLRSTAVQYSQC